MPLEEEQEESDSSRKRLGQSMSSKRKFKMASKVTEKKFKENDI